MTISHWTRNSSHRENTSADVVIIGAGYVGLSAAYWLTEYNPKLKILILDRMTSGAGASGRNAGFLTKGSAAFYNGLLAKWGMDKALQIYNFADESIKLAHQHILSKTSALHEAASSITLLRDQELTLPSEFDFSMKSHSDLPKVLKNNFSGGLVSSGEFKVDPMSLLEEIRKILLNRGVVFQENSSAFDIRQDEVITEHNRVRTQQTVLAMNGYMPQFSSVLKGIIAPKRAQMLAVTLDEDVHSSYLHYDPAEKVYWRTAGKKTIVIGGKRLLDEAGEESEFEKISPVIQNGLETYLTEKLHLNFKILKRWSGIMGFTEHELPLIQKLQGKENIFLAAGFSGHGMGFGFKSGQELAWLLTGRKPHSFFETFRTIDICL